MKLRFGRKLKIPSMVMIKHQIKTLMAYDERKKAEAEGATSPPEDTPEKDNS